ncbi:thiamine phosphate synthase [Aestuariivirga litoralis]|uniref:thiamine phosphate synthase n=1 Tax=Aestuariivirga litoralis TaxID=2650924 RepID=UPI0018C75E2B|nr:thiamine phosphate synthase [Aestuariivirga litoralis]
MPRLFLVAPQGAAPADILACAKAACAAADCASIVLHEGATADEVKALQDLGLAVLIADVEPRVVSHLKADGLHVTTSEFNLLDLRMSLPKDAMVGKDCGTSRHAAMEASEQGADYVGFRQKAQLPDDDEDNNEPLVAWWNELAEIPAVPLDPVTAEEAALLAPQSDFIRPSDEMWQNPDSATRILKGLNEKLK